jgi:hypothetical protein
MKQDIKQELIEALCKSIPFPLPPDMELVLQTTFDGGTAKGYFTLNHQVAMVINGCEVPVGDINRRGVEPGDFEMIKIFLPELLPVFEEIWDDECCEKWKQHCQALNIGEIEGEEVLQNDAM